MIKQTFALNDNTKPEHYVVNQGSFKYESGMSVQISQVLDLESEDNVFGDVTAAIHYKWIYEEINKDDEVIYARYMDIKQIKEHYAHILERGN